MSLLFVLGRSGAGKSTYVFEDVIRKAEANPNKRYLIIVPDQFTMQTQSDLVRMSPNGGIMNIEVLSFSRLAHRVFEETGGNRYPVLDDTGKNLIIRNCAGKVRDNIPYLAGKLDKPGYIHEVKSAISEFMQYDIDSKGLAELVEYSDKNNRRTLSGKLKDLAVIYDAFKEYIKEEYITTEESMDILAKEIYKSKVVKGSNVILDGFTGFTPIQNRVIGALMDVCEQVTVTLAIETSATLTKKVNEQDLFAFTFRTYEAMNRLASEHKCDINEPVLLEGSKRYAGSADLEFLEKSIYRYPLAKADSFIGQIHIARCNNIRAEVDNLAWRIRQLVREKNACYRDIAVVSGNLTAYKSEIQEKFTDMDIPVYIDETKGLVLNPFVEYIRAALMIYQKNFDFESVFQYLRTGFTGIPSEDVDLLGNYVMECGIKGHKQYNTTFSKRTRQMKRWDEEYKRAQEKGEVTENKTLVQLEKLNSIRSALITELSEFENGAYNEKNKRETSAYIKSIYNFIVSNDSIGKLKEYEEFFEKEGLHSKKREYSQVYVKVMKLLEQIYNLIGNEEVTMEEFYGILDAGFTEITIGDIPPNVDRIIVGDMERTRLKPVKYLFFLGLNDGWVPKPGGKGGIISDSDREFLNESGHELAPSPRQQMYIGRFYLYSNITKPSEELYLSYTAMDNAASSMRPSYVIEMIKNMFPDIKEDMSREGSFVPETGHEVAEEFALLVRKYAEGTIKDEEKRVLFTLADVMASNEEYRDRLISNAFFYYGGNNLDAKIAGLLYGTRLYASISKIEAYAKCAYAYFLKYGMKLQEKEEYGIEATDMGNIYHGVLEIFNALMNEKGKDWFTVTDDEVEELVNLAVNEESVKFTDAILFETSKNRYIVERMKKVMIRTIKTLAYQLKKGDFKPFEYEYTFVSEKEFDGKLIGLDNIDNIVLNGKIDRLDTCEKDNKILVKVVDYKSSNKDFSLVSFYHGVQLQMVVYMNEAIKNLSESNTGKEVVPAAMLYYHIDDPTISVKEDESIEAIESKIIKELRTKGLVNVDDDIPLSLDSSGNEKSDVIPVERNKNGAFSKGSGVIGAEDMKMLGEYADYKIRGLAEEMLKGEISTRPIAILANNGKAEIDGCSYCSYKGICGFNEYLPGYERNSYEKKDDGEVLAMIREDLTNRDGGAIDA